MGRVFEPGDRERHGVAAAPRVPPRRLTRFGLSLALVSALVQPAPGQAAMGLRPGHLIVDLVEASSEIATFTCADVDGDGRSDVVTADSHGARVWWGPDPMGGPSHSHELGALGRAPLVLDWPAGFPRGPLTAVHAADLSGDGRLDLVFASRGDASGGGLVVLLESGAGGSFGFSSFREAPLPGAWVGALASADFDRDGSVELVVGGYYDPWGDTVLAGPAPLCGSRSGRTEGLWNVRALETWSYDTTGGRFLPRQLVLVEFGLWRDPAFPFAPGALFAYGAALAVGDLDGDGYPDLAVGDPGATDRTGRDFLGAFNEQPLHPQPQNPARCIPQSGMVDLFRGGPGGLVHHLDLDAWDLEDRCASQSALTMQAARHGSALAFLDLDGDGADELFVSAPGWRSDWGGSARDAWQGQGSPPDPSIDARLTLLRHPIVRADCANGRASRGIGSLFRPLGPQPVFEGASASPPHHTESVGVALVAGRFGPPGSTGESALILGSPFLGVDPLAPGQRRRRGEISVVHDIDIRGGVALARASWLHLPAPAGEVAAAFGSFGSALATGNLEGSGFGPLDPNPEELFVLEPDLLTSAGRARRGAVHALYAGGTVPGFGLTGANPCGATRGGMAPGSRVNLLLSRGTGASGVVEAYAVSLRLGVPDPSSWPPGCWPLHWLGDPVAEAWWLGVLAGPGSIDRLIGPWSEGCERTEAVLRAPLDPLAIGLDLTLFAELYDLATSGGAGCWVPTLARSAPLHLRIGI